MDRKTAFAFLLGCAVGAAATGAGAYFLSSSMITSTPDCPLEFGVSWLNTSSGWFYAVESQRSEPRSLDEYNVTFYLLSPPDQYGNQGELVEHSGPLGDLVEATGNFSFEDRGAHLRKLDDGGDYFWAREWHNIRVERAGRIVGGTLGCA